MEEGARFSSFCGGTYANLARQPVGDIDQNHAAMLHGFDTASGPTCDNSAAHSISLAPISTTPLALFALTSTHTETLNYCAGQPPEE